MILQVYPIKLFKKFIIYIYIKKKKKKKKKNYLLIIINGIIRNDYKYINNYYSILTSLESQTLIVLSLEAE